MKNLNLAILFLMPCLLKVNAQDSIVFSKNDSIPFTNKYVSRSENYTFGLSSQLTGTYRLNTISQPLIVIDGIPYPDRTTNGLDYTTADINDIAQLALIPLESIESVELLDYDPSTLLYGSDAQNGVLSIVPMPKMEFYQSQLKNILQLKYMLITAIVTRLANNPRAIKC
jgi:hypothetical protein